MDRQCSLQWSIGEEATVNISINIDGNGVSKINTGHRTLDHFIDSFGRYGRFDITLNLSGDGISHHIFEQSGVALGLAIGSCLGDRQLLKQLARSTVLMDEAIAEIALDIYQSPGRFVIPSTFIQQHDQHDGVEASCYLHFLEAMVVNAKMNLHVINLDAVDIHHRLEVLFKAISVGIYEASRIDSNPIMRLHRKVDFG